MPSLEFFIGTSCRQCADRGCCGISCEQKGVFDGANSCWTLVFQKDVFIGRSRLKISNCPARNDKVPFKDYSQRLIANFQEENEEVYIY